MRESNKVCERGSCKYMQIHNSYLLLETMEGFLIVDQHALHERIIYDRLRDQLQNRKIIIQPLLFPERISLSSEEMLVLEEWKEQLLKIGLDFFISGDEVEICGLPQILGKTPAQDFFTDLLEQLAQTQEIRLEEICEKLLATMACKAAVKAGDMLMPEEIVKLWEEKNNAYNPFHCPHGRPTFLKMSIEDLEKHFHRR